MKYGGVRHVFGEAADPVKPEGPICMLCSPGRLPAKSGHHVSRHHQITSVRERFLGLKRTIKYGPKRTIQVEVMALRLFWLARPHRFTSQPSYRLARWCAYTSGVVSIFGIVSLVAFFTTFIGPLGILNDIAVVIQYVLMLPIAFALHQALRPHGPSLSLVAVVLGVAGMLGVIVLQLLFMTGMLPYAQYIVLVSAGFLVVLGWFVMVGYLGRFTDKLPNSMLLHVLAELYFGYPLWAFSLARRLRSHRLD